MIQGTCPLCGIARDNGFLCEDCHDKQRDKMVIEEFQITDVQFEELRDIYSGDTLQKNKVRGIFKHAGRMFIHHGNDHVSISCGEVIPLDQHDEPAIPYEQLCKFNGTGGYFHGNNQLVQYRGIDYVQIPYLKAIFTVGMRQESLF